MADERNITPINPTTGQPIQYGGPASPAVNQGHVKMVLQLQQLEAQVNSEKDRRKKKQLQAQLDAHRAAMTNAGVNPSDPALQKEVTKATELQRLLGPGAAGAGILAGELFAPGSLGRVSTGFDAQGNRIFETQDILNRLAAIRNFYQTNRTERTQETKDQLARLLADVEYSPEEQDIIRRQQAGLEGYSAAELQAAREETLGEVEKAKAAELRNLSRLRGMGATGTGALERSLARDAARARGEIERDIFIKNADEKQRRLGDYGTYMGALRSARSGRLGAYGTALSGAEEADYQRRQGDYQKMMETQGTYANQLALTREDELKRHLENLGRLEKEKAGQYGSFFGGLNLNLANRQFEESQRINDALYKLAKKRKGSSAATTAETSAAPNYAGYFSDAASLYS